MFCFFFFGFKSVEFIVKFLSLKLEKENLLFLCFKKYTFTFVSKQARLVGGRLPTLMHVKHTIP